MFKPFIQKQHLSSKGQLRTENMTIELKRSLSTKEKASLIAELKPKGIPRGFKIKAISLTKPHDDYRLNLKVVYKTTNGRRKFSGSLVQPNISFTHKLIDWIW